MTDIEIKERETDAVPARYWGEKPYRSLDWQMKQEFGEKVYKLALNGGMTCPNRDGHLGVGGCIFCSAGGSGEFAADKRLSVTEQIRVQKEALRKKKPARKYIAYFQAYTNTYGPVEYLRSIFSEAIADEEVAVLSVATRPDCLPEAVLDLLEELNRRKPVWVELGLQTIHERTAEFIRRGYHLECFERAVGELRKRKISVVVHTILGLPGEDRSMMLETVEYLNRMDIQGIKLQLLHILRGTDLGRLYEEQMQKGALPGMPYIQVLSMEEYTDLVIDCLEHLSQEITVHRITGDGPERLLLAPMWSTKKRTVLNGIHRELKIRNSWQGKVLEERDDHERSVYPL